MTNTLGDYIDTLKGFAFKSSWFEEKGTPIIKVTNFTDDSISMERVDRVSSDIAKKYKRYELLKDDVVVQTVGSWPSNPASVVGKVIRVPTQASKSLLNQNAVILKPRETLNKNYLFYLLKTERFKSYIVGTARGAASQASITLDAIKNFKFLCPPIEEQIKAAEILNNYDNLIENNTRRIAILETIAQNLYREWFINFRFPNHAQTRWQDTPQGKIPLGWETKPFTDMADVLGGGTPSTKEPEYWNGDIKFFAPKDAPDSFYVMDTEKSITSKGVQKSSTKVYPKDTVFITARGTVGKVVLPAEEMAMNQSCYALRMKSGKNQRFLFLLTKEQVAYLKKNTGGATFDTIVTDTFKAMHVTVPPLDLIEEFETLASPTFEQILCLLRKNKNLKQQRDMLLPKLISG